MLVSQNIVDAFNQQVGNELGASNQYVNIATYFSEENLEELAKFFFRQAEEEREHAMKFVHFLLDAGGHVKIPAIVEPKHDFSSAEEAVQAALDWETEVTQQIYGLVELAQSEKNYVAQRLLDWFVDEQLEEVSLMDSLLGIVRRAGENNLLYVEDYLTRHGVEGGSSVEE
ncbi:MAG: ferritin [Thermoanaerobaculia bacterium]|nr:ferritin [Thermoanaerobaculia bacterium]